MPVFSNIPKADLEKIALIGIVGFVVVFVLIQFGLIPSFGKLSSLSKDIAKYEDILKKNKALIADRPKLEARLASTVEKLKGAEKALPPHRDMPNILQGITTVAYESKVKIIKLEPLKVEKTESVKNTKASASKQGSKAENPKKPEAIYTEVPIQVEARGGYHALGEFINMIETSSNIMSIGDFEIKADPDDIQNHNARLLIVAYVLREEVPSK